MSGILDDKEYICTLCGERVPPHTFHLCENTSLKPYSYPLSSPPPINVLSTLERIANYLEKIAEHIENKK